MNKTSKSSKGIYNILFTSDNSQTGWCVVKTSKGWDLVDFEDDVQGTFKTKQEAVANFDEG